MKRLYLAAPAAVLMMSAAAIAQSESGSEGARPAVGGDWPPSVSMAFFTDDTLQTLKADADIQTAWGSLSEEERAKVTADCSMMSSTGTTATETAPASGSTDTNSVSSENSSGETASTGGTDVSGDISPSAATAPASGSTDTNSVSSENSSGDTTSVGAGAAAATETAPAGDVPPAISNTNLAHLCMVVGGM